MNNFLLFLGAVLVIVLSALFAVPHFVDWNVYRSTFESQAGKLLGRDVRVGGQVSMRLLPAPYVSFENVRVADDEGRFSEPPLRAEAFTLWLSIPPLLRGTVEASEVDLRKPELLVRLRTPDAASGAASASPAVVPVGIVLRSVNVHQGTVRIVDGSGNETLKLESINGEFAAPALEGPFRFRGTLQAGNREREVRVTTGKLEPTGALGLDATIRVPEQASVYQLVGRLAGMETSPAFTGDLTVKPSGERKRVPKQGTQPAEDVLPTFEIKSRLKLTLAEAELDDLGVMFEQSGTPQTLTGSARAAFGRPGSNDTMRITSALNARWLDLDRISGTDGKAGPRSTLAQLRTLARAWSPTHTAMAARIGIEQASLGADSLQNVEIAFDQSPGKVEITRLAADLPGGSRIILSGTISGDPASDNFAFSGPIRLRGQSLNRFLAWAWPGHGVRMEDGVGAYHLAGDLGLSKQKAALARMRGEIVATAFQGEASLDLDDRGEFSISIDSDRLDLRPFASGGLKLASLSGLVSGAARKGDTPPPAKTEPALIDRYGRANSSLRLRIGRLLLPDVELKDISADIRRSAQSTEIRALDVSTLDGLRFMADGRLKDAEGRVTGALKGNLEISQPAGLAALLRFVELPEAASIERRAAELMPLRLAGILTVGARAGSGFDLVVDGLAQDTRTTLVARGEQDLGQWRSNVLDLTATLENRKSARLLAQLVPGMAPLSTGAGESGRLSARAIGIARSGLSASLELETKAIETGFSGVITLPGDQPTLTGEIGLKAADIADGLHLAGLKHIRALQGRDLVLHSRLSAKGDEIDVTEAAMRLGSANVEARGRIKRKQGRIDLDVTARSTEASLPALLAVGLGTSVSGGSGKPSGAAPDAPDVVWPDDAIDLSALTDFGGKIKLEAQRLALGQGLAIDQATVDLDLAESAIDVKSIGGSALGGRVSGGLRVERTAAGAALQGSARLDGIKLDQLAPGASGGPSGGPVVTGGATVTLNFTGKGLTPRGVVSSLTGKGNVQLADARLTRLGPEALDAAIAQGLPPIADDKEPTEIKPDAAVFKPMIEAELAKTALALGTRSIPIEIADGAIRTRQLAFDVPRGRIKSATFVDLASARLDSETTIETQARFEAQTRIARQGSAEAPKPIAAAAVPGVTVTLTGPIGALASLEPQINSDALAREILVRRLERDLEAMERVRKKREEAELARKKAREDAERREEEERKARAAAAASPPPISVPAPVPVAPPDSPPPGSQSAAPAATTGPAATTAKPDTVAPAAASAQAVPDTAPPATSPAQANAPAPQQAPGQAAGQAAGSPSPGAARSGASRPSTGNRPAAVFDQSRGL